MNKKRSYLILLVVVILAVGGFWYYKRIKSKPTPSATQAPPTQNAPSGLTYSKAVSLYYSSRVQFDSNCQASPVSFILQNGLGVMLDNRSDKTREIRIDGKSYFIGPFGFKIVVLSYAKLPHDAIMDCGSGRNNAKITVE